MNIILRVFVRDKKLGVNNMKKLFIAFLLLFSFPIFAENLRDLPFEKILTTIDKQCRNGNKTACHSLLDLYSSGNEIVHIYSDEKKQMNIILFLVNYLANVLLLLILIMYYKIIKNYVQIMQIKIYR